MDAINSDIERQARIKALLEQLQSTRGELPQAMNADRENKLLNDFGFNAEKIGRAFSNQTADRRDYESEPTNVNNLTKLQESLKGDISGTYDEALHDPTSGISGVSREIYGNLGALPKDSIAGSSAKQLSLLDQPLKIKADIDQANTNAALRQAQIDAANRKTQNEGTELGFKKIDSETKQKKTQAEIDYMSNPSTPEARGLQGTVISMAKKAGMPINEQDVANFPAERSEKILKEIFGIESAKVGPQATTARIPVQTQADLQKLSQKQLADQQALEKKKQADLDALNKKALADEKLKRMGLLSGEKIASERNKTALEIARINAQKAAKASGSGSQQGGMRPLTQAQFDAQKINFSKAINSHNEAQENLNRVNQILSKYGTSLDTYKTDKVNLPGASIPGIGRVALFPKGAELKSAIQKILNKIIYDASGKAVNNTEMIRIKEAFNSGAFNTEEQMLDAVRDFKKEIDLEKNNLLSAFNPEVIKAFSGQGGKITENKQPQNTKINKTKILLQIGDYLKSGDPEKVRKAKAALEKVKGY